jgi:hypothetical protein
VVIALLCVLAIGLAASTLTAPVEDPDAGGSGLGGSQEDLGVDDDDDDSSLGIGRGSGDRFNISVGTIPIPVFCLRFLNDPAVIAAILGAFALAAGLAYRKAGIFGSIAVIGGLGLPTFFLHALLSTCERPDNGEWNVVLPNATQLPAGGSGGVDSGSTVAPSAPSVLVTVLLGLTLVAALVLFVKSTQGDAPDEAEPPVEDPDDEVRMAAVGRAAGAAADRIETTDDLDNEVYRAWREMTTHLDVARPRSSTPAEFAAAAVDAGIDREDVTDLTTLFEEVRYGDRPATEDREEQALAALRRIEEGYAGVDERYAGDDSRHAGDGGRSGPGGGGRE